MSALQLDDLLRTLREAPADASFDDVLRKLKPEPPKGVQEAIKLCALVRWFDPPLYERLVRNVAGPPSFEDLIELPEVVRLQTDRWSLVEAERSRLLAQWQQTEQNAWRRWNTDLGYYFAALRHDPDAELCAVYHLAASKKAERLITLFKNLYRRADSHFDLSQCNALLEMLRLQENWRGPDVSRVYREYRLYRAARVQFADEYYKSGSYLERPALLEAFDSVFKRKPDGNVWVFHLHATGGAGKTMFLRWLTARHLVPDQVRCAKIDFDDFLLEDVQTHPTLLFRRMVAQFVNQPQGDALRPLLEKLQREEQVPGWNPDALSEIRRQFKGAGFNKPFVVILDTLEGATLSAARWLETCLDALRAIHAEFPTMTLALSGRYDIAKRSSALLEGEYFSYDMPRFDEAEARRYLAQRGVPGGEVCDAIIARAQERDEAAAGKPAAFNPFKLGMCAELALGREKITAEDVRRFPRVDVAYLVERIIRRIDSQPLRWMVRYGAIAQRLNLEFAQEVLLPPLLEALRGQPADDAGKGLEVYANPDGRVDVWRPDPRAAEVLESGGMVPLWDQLSSYAREKGWLTAVGEDGETKLHFHPEVIDPTRALLRDQPVFDDLQARAASYFERKAWTAPSAESAARFYRGAIFHRFQAQGAQAQSYWSEYVEDAANRFGPAAAVPVAAEILGSDYCEAERIPDSRLSSAELIVLAHCRAADLLMQAAGLDFYLPAQRKEFCRHIEVALDVAGSPFDVPVELRRVYEAWQSDSDEQAAAYFRAAIPQAREPRERFVLEFQLAVLLLRRPAPDTTAHLREALRLLPEAGPVGVTATDLHLALASHYTFLGSHAATIEAVAAAQRSAPDDRARARVLWQEAWYAVRVGDIPGARRRMAEWRELPTEAARSAAALNVLEERLAIMECEPIKALRACEDGLRTVATGADRARLLDQSAESRAMLLDFRAALDDWDKAAADYDLAGSLAGSARCALLSAAMTAREMRDLRRAESLILSALGLRGSQDIDIQTRLRLLQGFVLLGLDQRDKADEILAALIARPDIPAHIRAPVLIFALVFGLREPSREFLEDTLQTLGQIQPLGRIAEALEWTAYADAAVDVPAHFVNRLMGRLPRPHSQLSSAVALQIRRADLYRLFGRAKEAARELDLAESRWLEVDSLASPEGRLLMGWSVQLARKRAGASTRFRELHASARSSRLEISHLLSAIACEAAEDALCAGAGGEAQAILAAAPRPPATPPDIWAARRTDLLAELATPEDRAALRSQADWLYQALGLPLRPASPPPPGPMTASPETTASQEAVVAVSMADLPLPLQAEALSLDRVIDRLCGDWEGFAGQMRDVLRNRDAESAPLDLTREIAALPWELAGTPFRQARALRDLPPESHAKTAGVQVFVSPGGEAIESYSQSVGSSLAQVYLDIGGDFVRRPQFDETEVRRSDDIYKALANRQARRLLHIAAAVRQGNAGIFLDFGSTANRAKSIADDFGYSSAEPIPARMLARFLGSMREPPFVVLDIPHPGNGAEAVRMMLLRNLFAAELVESGYARGVLACGLALPDEAWRLTADIVKALLFGSPGDALKRLRDEPTQDKNIERVLPRRAVALWTSDSKARIFSS